MSTDLPAIPPALVEAAARALDDHRGVTLPTSWWCECGAEGYVASQADADRGISHHMAAAVLAAALAECEVTEQFSCLGQTWHLHVCPNTNLRRYFITTKPEPASPVDTPREDL